MRIAHQLLIVSLAVAGLAPAWAQAPDFDVTFEQARALRTADPKALGLMLSRLEGMADGASQLQRNRLAILRAHHRAVTGDTNGAVASLERLTTPETPAAIRYEAGGLLANIYAITRKFEASLRLLEQVMPLQEEVLDRSVRHNGLQGAGIVYNQVGEHEIGMRYAEQVLSDSPDARSSCISSNLVLESKLGLELPIAREETERSIDNCDRADEPILAGFSRAYTAVWLHRNGRTAEAISLLTTHLPRVEAAGYPILIGQFHSALAEYQMALGHHAAATRHARATVDAIATLKSALPLAVAYRTLYELALREGSTAAALDAHRLYAEAERAHFNDVKSREMAYQIVRHQSLQQAQQIELLHQKNQLLVLQQNVTEQRARSWLLLALVLVGLVGSVGYWAYKTKRMQLRLKRMTETDALTGICNRQHFSKRAKAALVQCQRAGETAALVMFDLDHFKQVNDWSGHAAGDWALQQVAEAVRPMCRSVDAFGRLGGEEFALFLPGFDAAAAVRVANEVQARFMAINGASKGYAFRITASFGVAEIGPGGDDLATLMRHADQAMYAAKRGGRRQVRIFDPAMAAEDGPADPRDPARGIAREHAPAQAAVPAEAARRATA